jgi:hypothetical protein
MKKFSYKILLYLTRYLGMWFFRIFPWFIATGYFFLFPARVVDSCKFYRALFPGCGFLYHSWCAWAKKDNLLKMLKDAGCLMAWMGLDDMNMAKFTPFPGAPLWDTIKNEGAFNGDRRLMNCLDFVFVPKGGDSFPGKTRPTLKRTREAFFR